MNHIIQTGYHSIYISADLSKFNSIKGSSVLNEQLVILQNTYIMLSYMFQMYFELHTVVTPNVQVVYLSTASLYSFQYSFLDPPVSVAKVVSNVIAHLVKDWQTMSL
jgi:hypothetical protein